MKYNVKITYQAEAETDFAYEWILKSSPLNAYNWFEGLLNAIYSLEYLPERCPVAPESADVDQEVRCLLYGKFRILFLLESQTVFILHVRHCAQEYLIKENF